MPWPGPDLDAWEAALWSSLGRAVVDPKHPWRLCTLATTSEAGPDARMVVLREARPGRLTFATDARSPKVAQLAADPWAVAVFWHPRWKVQLRVRGAVTLSPWPEAPGQLADYAAEPPPGSPIPAHDAWRAGDAYHGQRIDLSTAHLDVLALRREGHLRAARTHAPEGPRWAWLAP